jgi:ABC-2 type transport system ATP-binding protein
MTPILAAQGLTKSFGPRVAVDQVSLELHRGQTFALVGPNGAGKTTTLRLLAGLVAPDAGQVVLDGQVVSAHTSTAFRRQIGLLTESPGLWDRLTVRENLLVYARLYEAPSPARAVDQSLERFDLSDRASDLPGQLSKGLRQRVALARTLLHDPAIALLDEPTSGLDPESARAVRSLVRQLNADGTAVLVCTHNLDEVERLASRVAVLRTRILAVDRPAVLRRRLAPSRVRIIVAREAARFAALLRSAGVGNVIVEEDALLVSLDGAIRTTPDVVRVLVEADAQIEDVRPDVPSLEEAYLDVLAGEST